MAELRSTSTFIQVSTSKAPDGRVSRRTGCRDDRQATPPSPQVGQGTVSEVERENEGGSAYEVEVRLNDGTQVEVQLGGDFQVLNQGAPERRRLAAPANHDAGSDPAVTSVQ